MTAAALTTYGSFYSTQNPNIFPGTPFPLDTRGAGTTDDLTLNDNRVTINTPGTYLVIYQYNPNTLNPDNQLGDVQLVLNNTPVPGTNIYSNPSTAGSQPATGSTLITVTAAGSTLYIQNTGTTNTIISITGSPVVSTQLTLVKVG